MNTDDFVFSDLKITKKEMIQTEDITQALSSNNTPNKLYDLGKSKVTETYNCNVYLNQSIERLYISLSIKIEK